MLALVEVGYQYWRNSPSATSPSVAGRPLSNAQTHLHTIALGDTPATLYLGTHFGLFWSTDGGRTWPQQRGALADLMITSVAVSPVDPRLLAVIGISNTGDSSKNGLYISQDAGATWRLSSPSLASAGLGTISPYFVRAGVDQPGHWYTVFLGAGLYETHDMGDHWSLLTPGDLASILMSSVLSDAADSQHVLLGTENGLYQTNDAGAHWDQAPGITGSVLALLRLPAQPETLFCATDTGLWRSTDDGAHFAGISAPSFSQLAVSGRQSEELYGVSGQQLWRSTDGGSHWVVAANLDRSDLIAIIGDPTDAQKLYVGYFFPPAVYRSQDGGRSWQVITS